MAQYRELRALGLKDYEMPTYLDLIAKGKSSTEALGLIDAMRTLGGANPTAREVATEIANRPNNRSPRSRP